MSKAKHGQGACANFETANICLHLTTHVQLSSYVMQHSSPPTTVSRTSPLRFLRRCGRLNYNGSYACIVKHANAPATDIIKRERRRWDARVTIALCLRLSSQQIEITEAELGLPMTFAGDLTQRTPGEKARSCI